MGAATGTTDESSVSMEFLNISILLQLLAGWQSGRWLDLIFQPARTVTFILHFYTGLKYCSWMVDESGAVLEAKGIRVAV